MSTGTIEDRIHEMIVEVTRVVAGYHEPYGGSLLTQMDLDVYDQGPIPGTSVVDIHYHIKDNCRHIVCLFDRERMLDEEYASGTTTSLCLVATQPIRADVLSDIFPEEYQMLCRVD